MRVLLVSMPFAALDAPSAALSRLKAQLSAAGVKCEVAYLGPTFADQIGDSAYDLFVGQLPADILSGEWVFAGCVFPSDVAALGARQPRLFRRLWPDQRSAIEHARAVAPGFIAACLEEIRWSEFDIVGFTSSFEQNMAALAMARAVKERFPNSCIAFGGANWEASLGWPSSSDSRSSTSPSSGRPI